MGLASGDSVAPFFEPVILLDFLRQGVISQSNLSCRLFLKENININKHKALCTLKTAKEVVTKLDFPLDFPQGFRT